MNNPVIEAIKNRRSHRAYAEGKVSKEEIETIIEAGLYAPSAHNDQSWHFTVIQDQELISQMNADVKESLRHIENEHFQKLADNEKFFVFYNAPAVIVISGEVKGMMAHTDCAAAAQNMLVAAESLGLGSCWIGFVRFLFTGAKREEYLKKLCIPEGYDPFYAIIIGKKKMTDLKAPERREGTVTYITN